MVQIDLSLASLSNISERLPEVWKTLLEDPLLYIPLVAWWFIFELFYLIHKSESYHQQDVLDNGLSSFYAGLYISPLIQGGGFVGFTKLTPSTILSIILMVYGLFLVLAAFVKLLPQFLLPLFGGASIDLVVNVIAIFVVDAGLAFDLATIAIVIVPMFLFKILGFLVPKRY